MKAPSQRITHHLPRWASPAEPLRCFARPATVRDQAGWLDDWMAQTASRDWSLSSAIEEALAELVPLLLCGEQSAQFVFHHQAVQMRQADRTRMAAALQLIEREEAQHERALQFLAGAFEPAPDLHRRKRRAQRFYAALSHGSSPAQHFARIEALDTAVSRIMYKLSGASWGTSHPLYFLFDAIKVDEARHVGVSRRYASALGIDAIERQRERQRIGHDVVAFLQPDADAFDALGVDPDQLFRHLLRGAGA